MKYRRLLKSKDAGKRKRAAQELGSRGDQRAVEPLIAALADQDPGVRQEAAAVLGQLAAADALVLAQLKATLGNRNVSPGVRRQVAAVLGPWAVTALTAELEAQEIRQLIAALGDRHPSGFMSPHARQAVAKLAQLGARAVEPLTAALKDLRESCFVDGLQSVLEHSLAGIDAKVLRLVTELEDMAWRVHAGCEVYFDHTINCAHVRQLARQELIRRREA